jgi:hypothetical protein
MMCQKLTRCHHCGRFPLVVAPPASIYETNRTETRPVLSLMPKSYSVPSNDRTQPFKNRTRIIRHPEKSEIPSRALFCRRWSQIAEGLAAQQVRFQSVGFAITLGMAGVADFGDMSDEIVQHSFRQFWSCSLHSTSGQGVHPRLRQEARGCWYRSSREARWEGNLQESASHNLVRDFGQFLQSQRPNHEDPQSHNQRFGTAAVGVRCTPRLKLKNRDLPGPNRSRGESFSFNHALRISCCNLVAI